jgi:hypothetical protein
MCTDPEVFKGIFIYECDLIAADAIAIIIMHKAGKDARFFVEPVKPAFKSADPDISPAIL